MNIFCHRRDCINDFLCLPFVKISGLFSSWILPVSKLGMIQVCLDFSVVLTLPQRLPYSLASHPFLSHSFIVKISDNSYCTTYELKACILSLLSEPFFKSFKISFVCVNIPSFFFLLLFDGSVL